MLCCLQSKKKPQKGQTRHPPVRKGMIKFDSVDNTILSPSRKLNPELAPAKLAENELVSPISSRPTGVLPSPQAGAFIGVVDELKKSMTDTPKAKAPDVPKHVIDDLLAPTTGTLASKPSIPRSEDSAAAISPVAKLPPKSAVVSSHLMKQDADRPKPNSLGAQVKERTSSFGLTMFKKKKTKPRKDYLERIENMDKMDIQKSIFRPSKNYLDKNQEGFKRLERKEARQLVTNTLRPGDIDSDL